MLLMIIKNSFYVHIFLFCLKEVHFLRGVGAKCPTGKLYSKYFNKIRNFKNNGLVPQQTKDKKYSEKKTRTTMDLDNEISN